MYIGKNVINVHNRSQKNITTYLLCCFVVTCELRGNEKKTEFNFFAIVFSSTNTHSWKRKLFPLCTMWSETKGETKIMVFECNSKYSAEETKAKQQSEQVILC